MAHHWVWSELEPNTTVEVLRPKLSPKRSGLETAWICHAPYTDPYYGWSPEGAYRGWRRNNCINFSERRIDVRII